MKNKKNSKKEDILVLIEAPVKENDKTTIMPVYRGVTHQPLGKIVAGLKPFENKALSSTHNFYIAAISFKNNNMQLAMITILLSIHPNVAHPLSGKYKTTPCGRLHGGLGCIECIPDGQCQSKDMRGIIHVFEPAKYPVTWPRAIKSRREYCYK